MPPTSVITSYSIHYTKLYDITVNYMMAKESVKKRIGAESSEGMSFTEFTYQLVQGYDFLHLFREKNCRLQMGGSDQWGNITTGTELIRRIGGGDAFALTCPLITKADGGKFGKTESGNVWLDANRTSPYQFFQFWMNTSDADAEKYIKIFTMLSRDEVNDLMVEQVAAPHLRSLQKRLAEEVTVMVHGRDAYDSAVEASQILFGNATTEALKKIDEQTLLSVFEGVPQFTVSLTAVQAGVDVATLLAEFSAVFPSKGELRRTIQGGGLSINKEKVGDAELRIDASYLLNNRYILVQKGKKNYWLLIAE